MPTVTTNKIVWRIQADPQPDSETVEVTRFIRTETSVDGTLVGTTETQDTVSLPKNHALFQLPEGEA